MNWLTNSLPYHSKIPLFLYFDNFRVVLLILRGDYISNLFIKANKNDKGIRKVKYQLYIIIHKHINGAEVV